MLKRVRDVQSNRGPVSLGTFPDSSLAWLKVLHRSVFCVPQGGPAACVVSCVLFSPSIFFLLSFRGRAGLAQMFYVR